MTICECIPGRLESPYRVLNSRTMTEERIGRVFRIFSNKRERIETVGTGDIVAVIGLKSTITGDTLCTEEEPVFLERMQFPKPVIFVAIEPRTAVDQQKMTAALQALAEEDPTFDVHQDSDTGQTIISGMGELHLEVLTVRLLREFKIDAKVGKPQVSYRESIRAEANHEEKFTKQLGGHDHYAHIVLTVESGKTVFGIPVQLHRPG